MSAPTLADARPARQPAPARKPGAARQASPARPLRRPVRRRWWSDAVGLSVWSILLVVVGLWVSNGGLQDLTAGAGPAMTTIGRLTGLIASALLLLQVLGMARIPWVERAVGQDKLVHWHRYVGFSSFNLMVVHIVLITLGYAAMAQTGVLGELWSLVTTAPGMLLATAGTAALVAVVVTSVKAARRRLRYESWHLIHLYAYLGAGLALPHQLWTGADFLFSPIATAFWWGLYILALGSVLAFRVGLPLWLSAKHRLTVRSVRREGPGVVTVDVAGRRLSELSVTAGQFFVWRFRTGPGWTRGHPLSVSAVPTTRGLRITVGTAGDDGERIARMAPGTRVLIEGPYGTMTSESRVRPRVAVIAAGVGVAPLVSLLHENLRDDEPPILLFRGSTEPDLVLRTDIDRMVTTAGLQVVELVGRRSRTGTSWLPEKYGHVPGPLALTQMIPDLPHRDVFICGPGAWSDAVVDDLRAAGAAQEAIHLEKFSW